MHHVARDEHNGAGAYSLRFAADRQFIAALKDEEHLFLVEMDVVGRAFTRLVPRHQDRNCSAGGLRGKEYSHVEAEGFDCRRLFEFNNGGLQRRAVRLRIVVRQGFSQWCFPASHLQRLLSSCLALQPSGRTEWKAQPGHVSVQRETELEETASLAKH